MGSIFVFVVYTIITAMAIFQFGGSTNGDLLLNFKQENTVISNIMCFIFMIIAATHTPFVFFVGKEALLIMIDEVKNNSISKHFEKMN